jgi:hypothetical protein
MNQHTPSFALDTKNYHSCPLAHGKTNNHLECDQKGQGCKITCLILIPSSCATHIRIHTHIYDMLCVCVCFLPSLYTHTHAHIHIYMYINIHVVCCVSVCVWSLVLG